MNPIISQRTLAQEKKNAGAFKLKTLHKRGKTHTVAGLGVVGGKAGGAPDAKGVDSSDRKIWQHFKGDLTIDDYNNSQIEIEESLKEITKSSIMELRQIAKPYPLVEKALQIVCALKGFRNLSWATARELLGKASMKVELKQLTAKTLKSEDVYRAQ